jgi:hypothetical protein
MLSKGDPKGNPKGDPKGNPKGDRKGNRQLFKVVNGLPMASQFHFWEAIGAFLAILEKSPNFCRPDTERKNMYPHIVEYWLQTWELTSFIGEETTTSKLQLFHYIMANNKFTISDDRFIPEDLGIVGAKNTFGVFIPFLFPGVSYSGFVVLSFKNGIIRGILERVAGSKVRVYCKDVPGWVNVVKRFWPSDLLSLPKGDNIVSVL